MVGLIIAYGTFVNRPRTRSYELSPVSIQTQSLALRALSKRKPQKKRKRLRWQAANYGCHCFEFDWLALAFVA